MPPPSAGFVDRCNAWVGGMEKRAKQRTWQIINVNQYDCFPPSTLSWLAGFEITGEHTEVILYEIQLIIISYPVLHTLPSWISQFRDD